MPTHALCGHIKAAFAFKAGDPSLDRFIGGLMNLSDGIFLKKTTELNTILTFMIQGKDINPLDFHTYSFKENVEGLIFDTPDGLRFKPKYIVNDPFLIKWLFEWDVAHRSANIIASMMKLKTAVLPREKGTEPSNENVEKHRNSISGPYTGDWHRLQELSRKAQVGASIMLRQRMNNPSFVKHMSDRKYFPIAAFPRVDVKLTVVKGPRTVVTESRVTDNPLYFGHTILVPAIFKLINSYPEQVFNRVIAGEDRTGVYYYWQYYQHIDTRVYDEHTPLQAIRFISEAGGKERVVTASNVVLQCMTYHLGQMAKTLNSFWPIQGVDSHERTTHDLAKRLAYYKGKQLFYSIDASSFTDRLPKEFSFATAYALLEQGFIDEADIASFEIVCNTPVEFRGNITKYSVGTPMGTFPSFPLASFANGMLVWIATSEAYDLPMEEVKFDKLPCKVIGDDIVIWDEKIALQYLRVLKDIGVETSPSKSIISPFYAEMCSKLICSSGVYQQKKINTLAEAICEDQYMSQYQYYGDNLVEIDPDSGYYVYVWKRTPIPIGTQPLNECDLCEEAKDLYLTFGKMLPLVESDIKLNQDDIEVLSYRRFWMNRMGSDENRTKYGTFAGIQQEYKTCPVVQSLFHDLRNILEKFVDLCNEPIINIWEVREASEQFHLIYEAVARSSYLDSHIFGLLKGRMENHLVPSRDYSTRDKVLFEQMRDFLVKVNRAHYDYTYNADTRTSTVNRRSNRGRIQER